MKTLKAILLCTLIMGVFMVMFALAALQQSYRLYPPTEAERAQSPELIKFLIGE